MITYNQKFFIVFYKLCNIFPKKRKRRIGYDYIGLFKQFYTIFASKITGTVCAVAMKLLIWNTIEIRKFIALKTAVEIGIDRKVHRFALTEQIGIVVHIAGGNQPLQSEYMKIECEIAKKITYSRVVAVAQNGFTFEMAGIML